MTRVRPLLLAAALAVPVTIAEDADQQQQVTTVSVFVPGYRKENWDDLAGSVVTSDSVATTYTIFCPDTEDCEISGPLPFTFAEGPSTFKYSGTLENRLTAVISCNLASTTAATCTEYSSFGSGFTRNGTTGPTELSRTETYTGDSVQWGVLTLTSPAPTQTGSSGAAQTINPTDTAWFFPSATSGSGGAATSGGGKTVPTTRWWGAAGLMMMGLFWRI